MRHPPRPTRPPAPAPYTPMEHLALVVSQIVAQGSIVAATVAAGKEHPLGVYANEYGRVIAPGKPQRKRLIGMIVGAEVMQALTDAFVAARESTEGQALLVKTERHNAMSAGQDGQRPC